ncbi:MAG: 3-hydroxyacyl-CoA dehydrogenase NAD-binding domain-containing protein, partial [Ilumatobacteraceae bacterium]
MTGELGNPPARVAVVGCGVIGAAWAARLRLRGVDVAVYDPSPSAGEVRDATMAAAVAAWDRLDLPTVAVGELALCGS